MVLLWPLALARLMSAISVATSPSPTLKTAGAVRSSSTSSCGRTRREGFRRADDRNRDMANLLAARRDRGQADETDENEKRTQPKRSGRNEQARWDWIGP